MKFYRIKSPLCKCLQHFPSPSLWKFPKKLIIFIQYVSQDLNQYNIQIIIQIHYQDFTITERKYAKLIKVSSKCNQSINVFSVSCPFRALLSFLRHTYFLHYKAPKIRLCFVLKAAMSDALLHHLTKAFIKSAALYLCKWRTCLSAFRKKILYL